MMAQYVASNSGRRISAGVVSSISRSWITNSVNIPHFRHIVSVVHQGQVRPFGAIAQEARVEESELSVKLDLKQLMRGEARNRTIFI